MNDVRHVSPALTIISGGQTGADRAGLEVAIELGLRHGGFCPRHRRAEDGRVPDRYQLVEHSSYEYPPRTQKNIEVADATIIFQVGAGENGTHLTYRMAMASKKPFVLIDITSTTDESASADLVNWLRLVAQYRMPLHVINIAGPRESRVPGIHLRVKTILASALRGSGLVA